MHALPAGPLHRRTGLCDLPAEIIQQIHLLALNPYFPQLNVYIYSIFASSSPSFVATYLLDLYASYGANDILVRSLRHPICDVEVAKNIRRIWDKRRGYIEPDLVRLKASVSENHFYDGEHSTLPISPLPTTAPQLSCSELPRRLFRNNLSSVSDSSSDAIHPLLPYLFNTYKPSPNSHKGYPLCRALLSSNTTLIKFLLSKGADPSIKNNLAVEVAIAKRDLEIVRLLIERGLADDIERPDQESEKEVRLRGDGKSPPEKAFGIKTAKTAHKKPRLSDRVVIDSRLVQLAIEKGNQEIVNYFVIEKGCMPPLRSIMAMNKTGRKIRKQTL